MRLIDADALCEGLVSNHPVVIHAKSAPTIDAVPVVRCKDCRWHEDEQPGMVYCPATVGGWVENDWFCKGGERKDGCGRCDRCRIPETGTCRFGEDGADNG